MPPAKALQELVQSVHRRLQERSVRVAVVGDMILDNAIDGVPGDVHPILKVPILHEASSQESIGGAANIALALTRLGVEVSLFGIVGSDLPGRQLENLLERQNFDVHLITERGWPTPKKDWIYRRGEMGRYEAVLRIDYDRPLSGAAREELVGEFRARCPDDIQVVLLIDHGLGSIGGPESLALVGLAKERRAKVVAIPRTAILRGQPLNAIVISPNEMRQLAGAAESADPRVLAARYAREYAQHVFMTLMEEGLLVCPAGIRDGKGIVIDPFPFDNPDWMGVRDITTAIVGVGLVLGIDPVEIGRLSSVFRHLVAEQRGNGRVLWRDVYRFVGLEVAGEG